MKKRPVGFIEASAVTDRGHYNKKPRTKPLPLVEVAEGFFMHRGTNVKVTDTATGVIILTRLDIPGTTKDEVVRKLGR